MFLVEGRALLMTLCGKIEKPFPHTTEHRIHGMDMHSLQSNFYGGFSKQYGCGRENPRTFPCMKHCNKHVSLLAKPSISMGNNSFGDIQRICIAKSLEV